MAADISESGGHDCRGDQRSNTKLDADYPLRVLYCGVCSLPTEYCEYMPDVAKCRQWLEKNFPNEFAKLTVENSPKQEAGISEGQGTAGEEEEKKRKERDSQEVLIRGASSLLFNLLRHRDKQNSMDYRDEEV